MTASRYTEEEFITIWNRLGRPSLVAREMGLTERKVLERRRAIENRRGISLDSWACKNKPLAEALIHYALDDHPAIKHLQIENGIAIVGSDAHYWPDTITTAHRAFVTFCRMLKPQAVIMNGDVLDGAQISRHPPIGWERRPSLIQELEACKKRLDEIEAAAPLGAAFIWTLGNHDGRFETRLATIAPEYAKVHGFHLKDHFPRWTPAWSAWINKDAVIKHRWKNGIHAPHNNTINSGKTIITGHLHSLKVTPWSDYTGTRYGVDCGTLSEPYDAQFSDYTETNPVNWRSGFVVLTFKKGKMLMPEMVLRFDDDHVEFRGHVLNADTGEVV
jgi:hypothetical protein